MLKKVKARITHGKIEPLSPIPFEEGTEVEVTAPAAEDAPDPETDPTQSTTGAWASLLDCERFERDVYENRLQGNRTAVSF